MTKKPSGAPREDGADTPSPEGNVPGGIVHKIRTIGKGIHARLFGEVEKTPQQLHVETLRRKAGEKLFALWEKADRERGISDSLEGVDFIDSAHRWYQDFFYRMEKQFPDDERFWLEFLQYLEECGKFSGMSVFKDFTLMQRMLYVPGKKGELFHAYATALVSHGDKVCSTLMELFHIHNGDPHKAAQVTEHIVDYFGFKPRASLEEIEEYVDRKMKNRSVYR